MGILKETFEMLTDGEHDDFAELEAVFTERNDTEARTKGSVTFVTQNANNENNNSPTWEPPTPFENVQEINFPTDALPLPLEAFVEALSDYTQTSPEMSALLSLGVLSAALQSKFTVEVRKNWVETLCLYVVAVAEPAERKSPVFNALMKPIYEFENEKRESQKVDIAKNHAEYDLLKGRLESAKKNAAKQKNMDKDTGAFYEVMDLTEQLEKFEIQNEFRLIADDCTPEKLSVIMEQQKGSITIASTEGGIFETISGRYSGNSSINLDIFLKGINGEQVTVDRIGRATTKILNPRLSMIMTVQPDVLSGLMRNRHFTGRGFCGRCLYAVCKSYMGHRKASPDNMPVNVIEDYNSFIRNLLAMPYKGTIRMSQEADEARDSFQNHIEKRLLADLEGIQDWAGKIVGFTCRIAALIHIALSKIDPTEIPISGDVMRASIKIADFLCVHALLAYRSMEADEDTENAKYCMRKLKENGISKTSIRDLQRICRKFKNKEEMTPAIKILVDMGYLKIESVSSGNGRRSESITVNPFV